jgi:HSP20 family molecular chaperone IbpA
MIPKTELIEVENSETPEKTSEAIHDELRRDFADWMTANEDLVWRPAIQLRQEDNEFAARALMPGSDGKDVRIKDLRVMVAPDVLLVKGEIQRGESVRRLMASVTFPRPVNPDRVLANIRDGVLSVRAEIAGTSKVKVFRPRAA